MGLSIAQLQALKADIAANVNTIPAGQPFAGTQVKLVPATEEGNGVVAFWYNLPAAGPYVVWRTDVSTEEVNEAVDWTEVTALTTNNLIAFQVLKDQAKVDSSKPSIRGAFNAIFPSASKPNTNAALLSLAKRNASNVEKLFATGSGTTGSPSTMAFEGALTLTDVLNARNS